MVRALLAAGADVNRKDGHGQTALHCAAVRGDADAAKVLLAAGAGVNAKDMNGDTPLHEAAATGHADVAKALIAAGADQGPCQARTLSVTGCQS